MTAAASFNSRELTESVHAVLRTAGALSSGTRVFPFNSRVVWPEVRAVRPAKPKQWLLERESFERDVVSQYSALENGVVRELVAGTGVGKSTVMPFRIAAGRQVNGLVLVPDATYALRTVKYITPKLLQEGDMVRVALLRSAHLTDPPKSPVVYFIEADTFLGRLACHPTILRDLGIEFIYLDESHVRSGAYDFFKIAVSVNIIRDCKVFYGTATASADVSLESGGIGRSVQAVDPRVMCVESPRAVTDRSPMHFKNIEAHTMIVLANDQEIVMWYNYYVDHDIPVYQCPFTLGHKAENGIDEFLEQFDTCVLLTTNKFRTSVTLNIDNYICSGYKQVLVDDFAGHAASLQRVPVTKAEQAQGCGRVGRYKYGRAYYSNVEVSPTSQELDDTQAFYLFLWAVVFSVKVNDPHISRFAGLFSTPLTQLAAAILLHGRLPPFLMTPYVGDGGFFSGWSGVADYVLYSHGGVGMGDDSEVSTASWQEYSTGVVPYVSPPFTFKSSIRFPREWNVIPAYAWALFQGSDVRAGLLRSGSVISSVSTVRPRPVTKPNASRLSVDSIASHGTTLWTGGRLTGKGTVSARSPVINSGALHRQSVTSAITAESQLRVPGLQAVQEAYAGSVRDSLPVVVALPTKSHTRGNSIETIPRNDIQSWRKEVTGLTHPALPPMFENVARIGSESSDERNALKLVTVDPVRCKFMKLYPMDPKLFDMFMERESAEKRDRARLDKLLTGRENINNMRTDATARREKQGDYFLSVIRVHNTALVQKYQLAANENASLVAKVQMFMNGDVSSTDTTIGESARLLKAFQLESYFVGVDSRTPRNSDTSSVTSPDYDYEEARARIMLSLGAPYVIESLRSYMDCYVSYKINDRVVANAWHFGGSILTAHHAFDPDAGLPAEVESVKYVPDDDDFIVFKPVEVSQSVFKTRVATAKENVYVVVYDKTQEQCVVLGDYVYNPSGDIAYIDTDLAKGSSGGLVVSVFDGAVLGLYVSYFGRTQHGPISLCVPAVKFIQYV